MFPNKTTTTYGELKSFFKIEGYFWNNDQNENKIGI